MLKSQFNDVKFAGRALLRASDKVWPRLIAGRAESGILQTTDRPTHERSLLCAHRTRLDKATARPSPWCTSSQPRGHLHGLSTAQTPPQHSATDMSERTHHDGSAGRAYTVEQKAAVLRIKRCAPTAYYEILGLEEVKKTCSDGEIKKAYRKLSLLTHPDKNGYAGADDAFKLVSKAFQVLSDPDKKSKFDQFGGDPDARFNPAAAGAGAGGSPFSGFAGQRGGGFQEEMTPEELFRQFFGGGFGAPFGRSKCHTHIGRGRGRSGLM